MKRRVIQRRVVVVLLLLLGGAIVNVAVAWGYIIKSPLRSCDPVSEETRTSELAWLLEQIESPMMMLVVDKAEGFGWAKIIVDDGGIDDQPAFRRGWLATECRAGWPLFSFFGFSVGRSDIGSSHTSFGLVAAPRFVESEPIELRGMKIVRLEQWMPIVPLWPGFAINTIFYAAILWSVLFAPGKLKRTLRRRRGLCPACAYPWGAGTSAVCTECGAAVTPR